MLGTRITQRMSELGIETQSDLASRAGLSVSYINGLIRGTRGKRLGHNTTLKLARALKVKPFFFSNDSATAVNSVENHASARSKVRDAIYE